MKPKNAKEILQKYLIQNNFDGLANPDLECGCSVEEIGICGYGVVDCVPAYKCKGTDCQREHKCFLIDLKKRTCDEDI